MRLGVLTTLNLSSGILQLLTYPPLSWSGAGFVSLVPHLVFLLREGKPLRLLGGVWVFRSVLFVFVGLAYGFFEPVFYLTSVGLWAGLVPVLLLSRRLIALKTS